MDNMVVEEITLTLKNKDGLEQKVSIHIDEIIDKMGDYIYEKLEDIHHTHQCTNESVGFCECEPLFEDYEIQGEITV
jgi:hypothetical protein